MNNPYLFQVSFHSWDHPTRVPQPEAWVQQTGEPDSDQASCQWTLINTPEAKFWPQLDLRAPRSVPLTPVLPAAHDRWVLRQRLRFRLNFSLWDLSWGPIKFKRIVYHTRIFTGGYHYNPVHTSIYGTNRAKLVPSPSTKQVHKKFHHSQPNKFTKSSITMIMRKYLQDRPRLLISCWFHPSPPHEQTVAGMKTDVRANVRF